MWTHQIKLAIRNFYRNSFFTLINIFGLSIGITIATLILLWVNDELQFDTFHKNYSTIYRIIGEDVGTASPRPLAPVISEEISEVLNASRLHQDQCKIEHKGELYDTNLTMIDNSFFEIFSFPFVEGNPNVALKDPGTVVMTQTLVKKLFGDDKEVLGRNITFLFNDSKMDFSISGIINDIPANSHIQTQCFISFPNFHKGSIDNWSDWGAVTYIQTTQNQDINSLISKINQRINKHTDYSIQQIQPLSDIHLYSSFQFDYAKTGSIKYVYLFSIIAIVIVTIACINYINLNISQAVNRFKEVGIRKAFGATKATILKQFITESLMLVSASGLFALIIVEFFMPFFNSFTAKDLEFELISLHGLTTAIIIAFIGFAVGIFSSLYLSSLRSISMMKPNISESERKISGKKILLMGQFTMSIAIMIIGLAISKQINFVQKMSMGFDKENLVTFNIINNSADNITTIKNELLNNNEILNCTSGSLLSSYNRQSTSSLNWAGKPADVELYANIHRVDYDFLKTYHVKMKEGRFFSENYPSDKLSSFIINESAARSFNIESPVGKTFTLWGVKGSIIGVVNDYFIESAHQKVSPAILWMNDHKNFGGFESITLRIKSNEIPETIAFAQSTITRFNNGYKPDYHFINSEYNNLYQSEKQLSTLFNTSSVIGIIISCIGLLGLISISTKRKSKEISIRKMMGATMISIINLLLKETVLWVSLGFIVACPIAWWIANKWLQNFAFRTSLDWWLFAFAGILSVMIALFTASYHSIKAARANPVEALRYE